MSRYNDPELNPAVDSPGMGSSPYPVDSTTMLVPEAPSEYVGKSPYPIDSSGDVLPKVDLHNGEMPLNMGRSRKSL